MTNSISNNENFNQEEFLDICKAFKSSALVKDVEIKYESNSYFNLLRASTRKNRRGEVVFGVRRPSGRIITVTNKDYPKGIFRIPTGGINYGEDIIKALYREIKEELGLEVEVSEFAGVLKIKLSHRDESFMFYSYIFILNELSGNLLEDASDDEVSEVLEVDLQGLLKVATDLGEINGRWSDWGKFRQATTQAVYNQLKNASDV